MIRNLWVFALAVGLSACQTVMSNMHGYDEPASEKFNLVNAEQEDALDAAEAADVENEKVFRSHWTREGVDLSQYARFDASMAFNDDLVQASASSISIGKPKPIDYRIGAPIAIRELVTDRIAKRGFHVLTDQEFKDAQSRLAKRTKSGEEMPDMADYAGVAAVLSTWQGPQGTNLWELALIVYDRRDITRKAQSRGFKRRPSTEDILELVEQSSVWRSVVRKPASKPVNPNQSIPFLDDGELESLIDSAFADFMSPGA